MKRTRIFVLTLAIAMQTKAGVVGFWNFAETSGTAAAETSGSGNNGTLNGAAAFDPGAGPSGGGAVDLTGGYVDMGNVYAFSGAASFSLEAWINTTQTSGSAIASRHYTQNQDGYFLGMNQFDSCQTSASNGKAGIFVGNGGGTCPPGISLGGPSAATINDGSWHEIVAVFNGTSQTLALYVDGVFDDSSTTAFSISSCPTVDFIVGGADSGSGGGCGVGTPTGSYTGLISDVAVFDNALSAGQVATTFANPGDPFLATSATPEPAACGLFSLGLGGLFLLRRRSAIRRP